MGLKQPAEKEHGQTAGSCKIRAAPCGAALCPAQPGLAVIPAQRCTSRKSHSAPLLQLASGCCPRPRPPVLSQLVKLCAGSAGRAGGLGSCSGALLGEGDALLNGRPQLGHHGLNRGEKGEESNLVSGMTRLTKEEARSSGIMAWEGERGKRK